MKGSVIAVTMILAYAPAPLLSTICIALLLALLAAQEIASNLGARWRAVARLLDIAIYPLLIFFVVLVATRVSAALAGIGR